MKSKGWSVNHFLIFRFLILNWISNEGWMIHRYTHQVGQTVPFEAYLIWWYPEWPQPHIRVYCLITQISVMQRGTDMLHFLTLILRGRHSGTSLKFNIGESIVWPLWKKNAALSISALVNISEKEHTAHISHTLISLKIVSNPERLKLKKFDLRQRGCSV